MTFPLNEMYGYSRLCDRLRSSAIIWKQVSLRSSAIIWKPALRKIIISGLLGTSEAKSSSTKIMVLLQLLVPSQV